MKALPYDLEEAAVIDGCTKWQAFEQMAAGVIATVPLVIMVLIFQRRIVEGLTAGASK